jgi:putative oxidoreductase
MLPLSRFWTAIDWLFRVVVAAVFLAAAVPKMYDPLAFAKAIANYRLPFPWIGLDYIYAVATFMPPLEAVAALALFWNRTKKTASLVAGGLLLLFIVLIAQAVFRGLNIDCGCFGSSKLALISAQKVGLAKIIENLILLGMCACVFWLPADLPQKRRSPFMPSRERRTDFAQN